MPELPEVETIVRGLRKKLTGWEFSRSEIRTAKCLRGNRDEFCESLSGRKILDFGRRGKNIIFHLSGGAALVVHLRMTGQLHLVSSPTAPGPHTHAQFFFRKHPDQLRFNDTRKFGRIWLEKKGAGGEIPSLSRLGPEPLGDFSPGICPPNSGQKACDQTPPAGPVLPGRGRKHLCRRIPAPGPDPPPAQFRGVERRRAAASVPGPEEDFAGGDSRGRNLRTVVCGFGGIPRGIPKFSPRLSAGREGLPELRRDPRPGDGGRPKHLFLPPLPASAKKTGQGIGPISMFRFVSVEMAFFPFRDH